MKPKSNAMTLKSEGFSDGSVKSHVSSDNSPNSKLDYFDYSKFQI